MENPEAKCNVYNTIQMMNWTWMAMNPSYSNHQRYSHEKNELLLTEKLPTHTYTPLYLLWHNLTFRFVLVFSWLLNYLITHTHILWVIYLWNIRLQSCEASRSRANANVTPSIQTEKCLLSIETHPQFRFGSFYQICQCPFALSLIFFFLFSLVPCSSSLCQWLPIHISNKIQV